LIIAAQRMVHIGQHLLAVGNRSDRVLKARLGVEARSPMEACCNGTPEGAPRPLERVALAVKTRLLGAAVELATDRVLPRCVARRSAQIEECSIHVETIAARVVLGWLVALLEVYAEAAVAGGQQQAGRSVHAYVATHVRVAVLAHGRASRTV